MYDLKRVFSVLPRREKCRFSLRAKDWSVGVYARSSGDDLKARLVSAIPLRNTPANVQN
jgi:hypothetical protein